MKSEIFHHFAKKKIYIFFNFYQKRTFVDDFLSLKIEVNVPLK